MQIKGIVQKGEGVGRSLGYPTANISCKLDLPDGVFYALVEINDKLLPSLLIKGFIQHSVEVHVINWSGDLYGKELEVEVLKKLRDIVNFDKVDELVEQIQKDIIDAKKYFKDKNLMN